MAIPQVSWDIATMSGSYNYTTALASVAGIASTAAATQWPIGTIDADGLDKAVTTFLIWNNKSGASAVSDMQNCKITVVDANHGNTGAGSTTQLLGGGTDATKWVSARCDSNGVAFNTTTKNFANIGNIAPAAIDDGAIGIVALGAAANTISGAINDGVYTTVATALNYALVTLKMVIPTTASAGPISGYLRASYSFV